MLTKHIVSHAGQELGPFSEDEIREKILANELLPIDYLYDEVSQDWVLISDKLDLKKLIAPQIQLPPPMIKQSKPLHEDTRLGMAYPTLTQIPVQLEERGPKDSDEDATMSFHVETPPPVAAIKNQTESKIASRPGPQKQKVQKVEVFEFQTAEETLPAKTKFVSTSSFHAKQNEPRHGVKTTQTLKVSGGIGTLSLKQHQAGKLVISLQDCHFPNITIPADSVVSVDPGPAKVITWNPPTQCQAGDEVEIVIAARDTYDNIVIGFKHPMTLRRKGFKEELIPLEFENGQVTIQFKLTTAETLTLDLLEKEPSGVTLPTPSTLTVSPGPAIQLILETPPQALAGESMPITLKAVDQFGNLATDFKGDVNVALLIDQHLNKNGSSGSNSKAG